MKRYRITGENTNSEICLHSSAINVDERVDDDSAFILNDKSRYFKKIALIIESGSVPYMEIEEYITDRGNTEPNQSVMVSKSRHLLSYVELETFVELKMPDSEDETLDKEKLIEENKISKSAIDDLEI